jgi:hypothetical protein
MIQRQIRLPRPVRDCSCGKQPRLIETRGNPGGCLLLAYRRACPPQLHFHLECAACGLTTDRMKRPVGAERAWNAEQLHSLVPQRAAAA